MNDTHPSGLEHEQLDELARRTSDALRALSHEHRLLILALVTDRERSVGELERLLNLPQPAVSQQLARLRHDDLVLSRRDGRTIYYRLNTELMTQIQTNLGQLLACVATSSEASDSQDDVADSDVAVAVAENRLTA